MLPYSSSRARAPRRDDARRVGLVDEQRPRALAAEQSGAVADGRLDRPDRPRRSRQRATPSTCGERADRGERVVARRRRPLDAGERAHRNDVERIVRGTVAVGADVLGHEVGDEAVDVDGPGGRDGQLVGLAGVAHVGVARDAHRRVAAPLDRSRPPRSRSRRRRRRARPRDLRAAKHQRPHDLVLGVREEQAEGAEDAGRGGTSTCRIPSARAISTPVSGPLPPNAQSAKSRGSRPR